ncbi:MAG: Flp family type IVb pilin [Solidesulfovibrio sp.]|jgi:Flp pilus assembly pilin Flp
MKRLNDLFLAMYVKTRNFGHGMTRRLRDENGATTVEYALLIAVIVIGIIAAATYMFDPLKDFFKDVVKKVKETAGTDK